MPNILSSARLSYEHPRERNARDRPQAPKQKVSMGSSQSHRYDGPWWTSQRQHEEGELRARRGSELTCEDVTQFYAPANV